MYSIIKILLLEFLILSCLYIDIKSQKIPNIFTFTGLGLGLIINFLSNNFVSSLKGVGLTILVFLVMYMLGGITAGDVKFMAAAGAIMGYEYSRISVPAVTISGILIFIVILIKSGTIKDVLQGTWHDFKYRFNLYISTRTVCIEKPEFKTCTNIPYMPVIALGLNLALAYQFYVRSEVLVWNF